MATTINGISRYNGVAQLTTLVNPDMFGCNSGYNIVHTSHAATSGATVSEQVAAPCDGKLVGAMLSADVTSDGTKTYTVTVTNESNTDAAMLATTVYDDSPVLTADTPAQLTVSATAANLVVSKGDKLLVSVAGGTGAGDANLALYFVPTGAAE